MSQLNSRARVLEEWFRLPLSRRRDPTDAVAFAYRILRERPELVRQDLREPDHEVVVSWLLPHLARAEDG